MQCQFETVQNIRQVNAALSSCICICRLEFRVFAETLTVVARVFRGLPLYLPGTCRDITLIELQQHPSKTSIINN